MKKIAVVLLVVLFLVSSLAQLVMPAGPGDCLDACTTGCVGKYINDGRKRARCDEKCAIKCGPGAAAANNKVGTIIEG